MPELRPPAFAAVARPGFGPGWDDGRASAARRAARARRGALAGLSRIAVLLAPAASAAVLAVGLVGVAAPAAWAQGRAAYGAATAQPAPPPAPPTVAGYPPLAYGDRPTVAELTALGRLIFLDRRLSASGQSCASCHVPERAFGPPDGRAVQPGGPGLQRTGLRAVPSLRYLQTTLPFSEHYIDDDDGHGEDGGPTGGLTWDGRADSARQQALLPLFNPHEMALRDADDLARRLRGSAYAARFSRAVSPPGGDVFATPQDVLGWVATALEVYQQSAADFYPFTSKYDAYLRGTAALSPRELRGLAIFNDPGKGNCASCHPSAPRSSGGFPLFTDSAYAALGVPRNPAIPANRDPRHVDLGLCGPLRTDLQASAELCGRFKTPSLRNVALRRSFFHNGVLHSLREVLRFYATRDTEPGRWYSRDARGRVQRFDDLPATYRGNVNMDAPFGRRPGERPALTEAEIDDLIAFLSTLTDGYTPPRTPPRTPPVATAAAR